MPSPHSARSPRAPLSAGATATRSTRDSVGKRSMIRMSDRGPHIPHDASPKPSQPDIQKEKEVRRQQKANVPKGKGRATMFFTVQTPPTEDATIRTPHCQAAFPSRGSPFLASFKQNQRINSARQNFSDPSTTPPTSPRHSKVVQSKTPTVAAQFPVTRIEPQASRDTATLKAQCSGPSKFQNQSNQRVTKNNLKNASHKAETSNKNGLDNSPGLSVNTLLPMNELKPFLRNPIYSDSKNIRYVLKTGQASSVLIDNDKVVVMKSSRPYPHSAPSSRENSASYLAHLRRLYLKDPKDFAKANRSYGVESMKRKLLYERLEYDKRTDSILNYYSRADDVEIATAWASAVEFSRRPNTTSANTNRRLEGAKTSRPYRSPSRPTSARTRPNSARFPLERTNTAPNSGSPRDALADWGEFLKINSRSALHERQFYLRTPALGRHGVSRVVAEVPGQQEDCVCRLCQLEAEVDETSHQHDALPQVSCRQQDLTLQEHYLRGQVLPTEDTGTHTRNGKENVTNEASDVNCGQASAQKTEENNSLLHVSETNICRGYETLSTVKPDTKTGEDGEVGRTNTGNGEVAIGEIIGAKERVSRESSPPEHKSIDLSIDNQKPSSSLTSIGNPGQDVTPTRHTDTNQADTIESGAGVLVGTEATLTSNKETEEGRTRHVGLRSASMEIHLPSLRPELREETEDGDSGGVKEVSSVIRDIEDACTNVPALKDSQERDTDNCHDNMIINVSSHTVINSEYSQETNRPKSSPIKKRDSSKTTLVMQMKVAENGPAGQAVMDISTGELYVNSVHEDVVDVGDKLRST